MRCAHTCGSILPCVFVCACIVQHSCEPCYDCCGGNAFSNAVARAIRYSDRSSSKGDEENRGAFVINIQRLTSPIVCMHKLCIIVASKSGYEMCAHMWINCFLSCLFVCAWIAQHSCEPCYDCCGGGDGQGAGQPWITYART